MKSLKYIIFSTLVLMAFKTGDSKSEYIIPSAAYSIFTNDIDLDGDVDIIVGHNYNWQTLWSGVSILHNNGNGYFTFTDSVFLYGWQPDVTLRNLNDNLLPEIIAKKEDPVLMKEFISIIYDNDNDNIIDFNLNTYEGVGYIKTGDVDGNNNLDIVVASNQGQFWGVLYNDGAGSFSSPQYHDVEDYYPSDIACADLNEDGRDDIVIVGQKTEVYFSYASGFQLLTLETNDYKSDLQIADIDKDGKKDIATFMQLYPYDYSLLKLYRNIGNNNIIVEDTIVFQPVCNGVFEFSDFNNDSLPDFLFQNLINTELIIYYNTGNFTLSSPQYIPVVNYGEGARRSSCDDFDGNGYNDIVTIRSWGAALPANVNILFNDGQGNFIEDPITGIESQNLNFTRQNQYLSCYPNPMKNGTNFNIEIKEPALVELTIYNLQGKPINNLVNKKLKGGIHKIKWDGVDNGNHTCNPGPYYAYLAINGKIHQVIKLLII